MEPVVINPGDANAVDSTETSTSHDPIVTDPSGLPPIDSTPQETLPPLAIPATTKTKNVRMKHQGIKVFFVGVMTYFLVVGVGILVYQSL